MLMLYIVEELRTDMPIDHRDLRNILGHFATGVTIVTTRGVDGERVGVTVNSFNSVSLSPELVLFSLTRSLLSLPVFEAADSYGINFLAADQQHLSNRFARRGQDKWTETLSLEGEGGIPLIHGALAHIECAREQILEAGDHLIFLCRVTSISAGAAKEPLLFFKGGYCGLSPLTPQPESLPSNP